MLTKNIQLDEILYDKDYTLEVTWKAANGQSSAIGYAREFMLTPEEAYLKKVYDGTADASRLKVEVISSGNVPFYTFTSQAKHDNDVTILPFKNYKDTGYYGDYINNLRNGMTQIYKTRITLDGVEITHWENAMQIEFKDTGNKYTYSNNNS